MQRRKISPGRVEAVCAVSNTHNHRLREQDAIRVFAITADHSASRELSLPVDDRESKRFYRYFQPRSTLRRHAPHAPDSLIPASGLRIRQSLTGHGRLCG